MSEQSDLRIISVQLAIEACRTGYQTELSISELAESIYQYITKEELPKGLVAFSYMGKTYRINSDGTTYEMEAKTS